MPPNPGIEAAALGASESALLGTAPAEALHTFTLDLGGSRYFFRDSTTLTPLPAHVPVILADPSGGPVLARSSTVLPCPAVPSGSLSGLHLPSFSTNLVSTTTLQDAMVTTTTPRGQRVSICTCTRTGRHLATFTRRPGSSLYTQTIEPPQVVASAQQSASGPVSVPYSCHLLSHQTLLWHHCLGHPSLPRLRGMHSRLLRAAPHSSSLPLMTAPLQTLHMDVWGPTCVRGKGRERYFLLVVDDYMRYTMVFPLRNKGEVPDALIPWICAVRLQIRERFREDLRVLRLHSDRGGEFSSNLLRDFCRGEGILQTFMLPAFPQQNGVAEPCIGLVMEVARTSMIHAAAPHFLWPFAVRYASHQLNLKLRLSLPETLPALRWTGKVGDASVFRGPAPSGVSQVDPPPLAEHVEVTVDSSVARGGVSRGAMSGGAEPSGADPSGADPASAEPGGAESEGAEPGGAETEGAEPGGAKFEGAVSGGAEPRGTASAEDPVGASPRQSRWREPLSPWHLRGWFARRTHLMSGAAGAGGPAAGGTGAGGAGATSPGGAGVTAGARGTGGAGAVGPGGAHTKGIGARDPGAGGNGAGDPGAGGVGVGNPGAGGTGAENPGAGGAGAGGAGAGGAGAGDPRAGGTGAGGAGAGGTGAGGAGARDPGAGGTGARGAGAGGTGAGGTVQQRPFYVPPPPSSLPPPGSVFRQVLSLPYSTGLTPRLLCPPPHQSQPQLQPDSPLPAPSPYAEQTDSLTEHREPESSPASLVRTVRTGRRVPRPRPSPVPSTHIMELCPSSVPLRVPLASPPASSRVDGPDPESDLDRAASRTVPRLLATVVTDPSFESTAVSALVVALVDFAAACRLDYAASLVAESESDCPPSVGGECALGTDVLEDRQEDFECLAAVVPHLVAMLLAPEGDPNAPDIPTPCSYDFEDAISKSMAAIPKSSSRMHRRHPEIIFEDAISASMAVCH
ncbi:unnamed protein product [Closterium sp. NIES-54]